MPYYSYPLTKICLKGVIGQLECVNEEDLNVAQVAQLMQAGSNIQCFPTGGASFPTESDRDSREDDEEKEDEILCVDQSSLAPNNVNNPYANNNNMQCMPSGNEVVCFDTSTGSPYGNTGNTFGQGIPFGQGYYPQGPQGYYPQGPQGYYPQGYYN